MGLADNRVISIALGRTFSWMDLVCYAVGCVATYVLDRVITKFAGEENTDDIALNGME